MIGVRDWICDLLISRGALVEPGEGDRIGAMLPAEVATALGLEDWFSFDLKDESAEWIDRMERLLPETPLSVATHYGSRQPVPPIDVSAVLSSELAIQNGIWRVTGDTAAAATYLFFTFQYTIESDDRSTGITTVCLNADAGSLVTAPESFLAGLADGLVEGADPVSPEVIRRWYPCAARASQADMRKHVAQAEENANRRLSRDTERVESYYAQLLAQIEKRISKRSADTAVVEKERTRAEATRADREAKLEDLRRRYALHVRTEPALLLVVRAPVRRISVRFVRKKEERSCTLDWNPVLKVLELPLCEHCSARAHPIYLCERVHLLCKDCWVHCPHCSRFFCRVCQKQCRCGREPVARGLGKV